MWSWLRRVAHSPIVNGAVGLFMVATALLEIAGDSFGDLIGDLPIGVGHGMLAVGLLHTLKAIPELADGAEKIGASRSTGEKGGPNRSAEP